MACVDAIAALPHDEVDSSEFYKHVESGLPEPRRMRQLLTWCGTRALGEKPSFSSEDSHARLAGRSLDGNFGRDIS
jgi:kinetochore protein Mis13/DSN1